MQSWHAQDWKSNSLSERQHAEHRGRETARRDNLPGKQGPTCTTERQGCWHGGCWAGLEDQSPGHTQTRLAHHARTRQADKAADRPGCYTHSDAHALLRPSEGMTVSVHRRVRPYRERQGSLLQPASSGQHARWHAKAGIAARQDTRCQGQRHSRGGHQRVPCCAQGAPARRTKGSTAARTPARRANLERPCQEAFVRCAL